MRHHIVLTFAVCLLLAGCATPMERRVLVPETVTVTVDRYVPIPDRLTAPCPIAEPKALTVGEAVAIARERRRALEVCNAQLRAIHAVQGTAQPAGGKP